MSKWISEDGAISFEINEHGAGFGTLKTNTETIDIYFATGLGRQIHIYRMVDGNYTGPIEQWEGDFTRKDRFTAKVHEKEKKNINEYWFQDDVPGIMASCRLTIYGTDEYAVISRGDSWSKLLNKIL